MAPQFYSVDVHVGTRHLDDQTLLVVVDWAPEQAEVTRRQLNARLWVVANLNRALGSDLRQYALKAFRVDATGERTSRDPVWSWHYQPSLAEVDKDRWWQL